MLIKFQIPDPPFVQYFTTEFTGPEALTASEKVFVERAVPQRVNHFSTGRFCAKQALHELGISNAELLVGEGKQPLWPKGIVGSISHAKQMAGAVAAPADKLVSIGLDIETIGGVKPDMWDMLFLPSEQEYLGTFEGDELALQTTILFSGKEAFYKFQYPLTGTFLDFTDVKMKLIEGQYYLSVMKDFPGKEMLPGILPVHFALYKDQVVTLCYFER